MTWHKYDEIDWRPIIDKCVQCGQPIYGTLGIYRGQDYFLLDDGTSVHDNAVCGMGYLRDRYLIKG